MFVIEFTYLFFLLCCYTLEPLRWHFFQSINKNILYQPECVFINKTNYINECKKYNIRATPLSISDLDHWSVLEHILTKNITKKQNKNCLHNNVYALGGEFINNSIDSFYWYDNTHFNKHIFNIKNVSKYISVSLNSHINTFNEGYYGILCELITNTITIHSINNNDVYALTLETKIFGLIIFILALIIVSLLVCFRMKLHNKQNHMRLSMINSETFKTKNCKDNTPITDDDGESVKDAYLSRILNIMESEKRKTNKNVPKLIKKSIQTSRPEWLNTIYSSSENDHDIQFPVHPPSLKLITPIGAENSITPLSNLFELMSSSANLDSTKSIEHQLRFKFPDTKKVIETDNNYKTDKCDEKLDTINKNDEGIQNSDEIDEEPPSFNESRTYTLNIKETPTLISYKHALPPKTPNEFNINDGKLLEKLEKMEKMKNYDDTCTLDGSPPTFIGPQSDNESDSENKDEIIFKVENVFKNIDNGNSIIHEGNGLESVSF